MNNNDYLIKAIDKNLHFVINAAITSNNVRYTEEIHKSSPQVTSALGRLLTGTVLLAAQLKEKDKLSLQITCEGPVGGLFAEATSSGFIRGYSDNPGAESDINDTKLRVSSIIGKGYLSVIKSLSNQKYPYIGKVRLANSEIATDITHYLRTSEQIPSMVALGTLTDKNMIIKSSGGIMIQALPEADIDEIAHIENIVKNIPPISHLLNEGLMPEDLINTYIKGIDFSIINKVPIEYKCNCSVDKVHSILKMMGIAEVDSLIKTQNEGIFTCEFCNTRYRIPVKKLMEIKKELINMIR